MTWSALWCGSKLVRGGSDVEMSTPAERRQTKLELTLLLSFEEREENEEVQAVENR